ncbi:MAG: hypothetical protein GXP28_03765 [Planctomycetes bacterium]|nr:hypothetical protein [Planctomycetota bacterium]
MRKTILARSFSLLSLALLVGISSVGCKSMPKNPWAKTAATSDPAAPALAHTAPTKPSALAKQMEGLAAAQIAGGEATPFVPSVNIAGPASMASMPAPSSSYPTTTAPSFMQTVPDASVAATTPTPSANGVSTNLGSVKLPYDPSAVPPAILSPAEAAIAAAEAASKNRYASVPTPTGTPPQLSSSNIASVDVSSDVEPPKTASRYGDYAASVQTSVNQVAAPAQSLAAGAASMPSSHYAQTVPTATETPSSAASSYAPPVTAISEVTTPGTTTPTPMAVASAATAYRPGGTTSYPATMGLAPGIEIATRPNSPASADTQVPNSGTPASGESTPYPVTPQTPRYR